MSRSKRLFTLGRGAALALLAAALTLPPVPATAFFPSARAAAAGTDNAVWVTDSSGASFAGSVGGATNYRPAVFVSPDGSFGELVVGTDHDLWVTVDGNDGSWRRLSPNRMWCQFGPSVFFTGNSFVVACVGQDNAVWVGVMDSGWSGHAYPVAILWISMGGNVIAGPGLVTSGGIAVLGLAPDHSVWVARLAGTHPTWVRLSDWKCNGDLAAINNAAGTQSLFACQGPDHAVWVAQRNNSTCSSFCAPVRWGGNIVDGPGITGLGSTVGAVYAEGTDGALWRATSPGAFARVGGAINHGAAAAARGY